MSRPTWGRGWRPPVRRAGDRFRIELGAAERELLAQLPLQVAELLGSGDPVVARLSPVAYPDDPSLQREYRELTGTQLDDHHRRCLNALAATAQDGELDEDAMAAWLFALTDLRLVLGTRLDATDDPDAVEEISHEDPLAPMKVAYHFLGWLQQAAVEAVAAALPDGGVPGADDTLEG